MWDTPELQYMSYNGGRLAYRETGAGSALFLLHGMNGSSRSWAYLFRALGSSFRVVAWDAPGFGASDVFGDGIEDYVDAAKALLNALRVNDVIVVGHSMGGLVAAQLAADRDTSTAGLVLSSTHLGFARPKGEPLMARYGTRSRPYPIRGGQCGLWFGTCQAQHARRNFPNRHSVPGRNSSERTDRRYPRWRPHVPGNRQHECQP